MKHKGLIDEAADLFEEGYGREAVAARLGVNDGTVRNWEYAYRALGKEALLNGKRLSYSQDLKLEAARMFLDDGMTKSRIMEELGIKSKSALERWIREYRTAGAAALEPKPGGRRPKPGKPAYATREEELEARVRELELENEILKRISALADEIEQRRRSR
ncbi:helix-turn-helix domain-containing protein [Slackia faecicanis]|uniref:helix-turn-helix domain-containing protein n=1 Tax=Slackia faecicanis TaxID=255723 RepID=UPI001379BB46|nr:helix-turn-helix domain-containing protein [Slackia faecicanis]